MKKLKTIIPVIAATVILAGCAKEDVKPDQSSQTEDTKASEVTVPASEGQQEETTAAITVPASFNLSEDQQLQAFYNSRDTWLADDTFYYAISDLNSDSRLELIVSSLDFNGYKSVNHWYEVGVDGTVIEIPVTGDVNADKEPDIAQLDLDVYKDSAGNSFFVGCDMYRDGFGVSSYTYYKIALISDASGNDVLVTECLGSELFEITDSGEEYDNFYDKDGKLITEDELEELIASSGASCQTHMMSWKTLSEVQSITDYQGLADMRSIIAEV